MTHEGVRYFPFVARFRTTDGKRRQVTIWSPGRPWVSDSLRRYLDDRDDVDATKPIIIQEKRS